MHQQLYHLVRRPDSTNPPLLILLHGYGSNEEDLFGLEYAFSPDLLIISIRAPLTLNRGSYAWFPIEFTPDGLIPQMEEFEKSRQTLLDFVDWALIEYGADASRVILLGFSQGAMMSGALAFHSPEKFKATVMMSGRLLPGSSPSDVSTERLKKTLFLVIHGTQDQVIPPSYGRETHSTLTSLGVEHTYKEFAMPHTINEESLDLAADWVARLIG